VIPNQWLLHAQNGLGWRTDKKCYGPGSILQAQSPRRQLPVRDQLPPGRRRHRRWIYIVLLGCSCTSSLVADAGKAKPSAELATSTYGRPLVRKG
jgi:hypothetical protein